MKPMALLGWFFVVLLVAGMIVVFVQLDSRRDQHEMPENFPVIDAPESPDDATVATFGTGCFWCTEAIFQQLKGVQTVTSGYTGGQVPNPTYDEVCRGITGHAEAIRITYDPKVITYPELLEVFWRSHDPTTLNRQGNDVGTQYRSAIFYHTPRQRDVAEKYKSRIDEAGVFTKPIVTEIVPAGEFYPAEGYHQNYYQENRRQGYCRTIIGPKLDKLQKVFAAKWK